MSYAEAARSRSRNRKNAKVNALLMALSRVGGLLAQNQQLKTQQEQRMALENLRYNRDVERDDARQAAMDARQDKSIASQERIAQMYSQSRSQGGTMSGLEAETIGWDMPDVQKRREELMAIANSDDPQLDAGKKLMAMEQLKDLPGMARRAGMRQHMASRQARQAAATGQNDAAQLKPQNPSAQPMDELQLMSQVREMGGMDSFMPQQQPPSAATMPAAAGVSPRSQAQYGAITDAFRRMMSGQGSPADEALINEFFLYSVQQGPGQPKSIPFQIPPGVMPPPPQRR